MEDRYTVAQAMATAMGYTLMTAQRINYTNQAYEVGAGQNLLLDSLFDGNQDDYDEAMFILDFVSMSYLEYAAAHGYLVGQDEEDGESSSKPQVDQDEEDGKNIAQSDDGDTGNKSDQTSNHLSNTDVDVEDMPINELGFASNSGTVSKNKLSNAEFNQAEEIVNLQGGHFEGQTISNTLGIDVI